MCKTEALDVVKTVTLMRRVLDSNLLEYDFGTTDGFKKKLLMWENQIVDFQKATGEVFSDRLKCAMVLSRSP